MHEYPNTTQDEREVSHRPATAQTAITPMAMLERGGQSLRAAYHRNPTLFIVGAGSIAALLALSMRNRQSASNRYDKKLYRNLTQMTAPKASGSSFADDIASTVSRISAQSPEALAAIQDAVGTRIKGLAERIRS